jgi:Serine/threonine protein phosphatase
MKWKAIGQSVTGTSHIHSQKSCEDAVCYTSFDLSEGDEVLLCAVSDGAGSAQYAAEASSLLTTQIVRKIESLVKVNHNICEVDIISIAEDLYNELKRIADDRKVPLNEFSCTLLGCVLLPNKSIFFQVGDGAIIRNDGTDHYVSLWWPQNGEYQNTTYFFVDEELAHFKVMELFESIYELAILSDGLQLLVLNLEQQSVHQPFFKNIFTPLRMADKQANLTVLDDKLYAYLNSELINSRTDDDKTLFLATRLHNERSEI